MLLNAAGSLLAMETSTKTRVFFPLKQSRYSITLLLDKHINMMQIVGVKKQNSIAISVHLIISIIFSVLQVSGTTYLCQYPNDHLIISRQSDLQEYQRIRHYSLAVLSLSAYLDQLEDIKKITPSPDDYFNISIVRSRSSVYQGLKYCPQCVSDDSMFAVIMTVWF